MGGARHLAAWVAAIVFFVLGAIWYSVLSAQWLAAIGKTTEQMAAGQGSPIPFVIGFVAANLALNYGFERRSVALWLINAVYAVVGLGIAGAIIGGWKRRAP